MDSFSMTETKPGDVTLDANGFTPEENAILAKVDAREQSKGVEAKTISTPADTKPATSAETPPPPATVDWEKRYKDLERKFQQTQDQLRKVPAEASGVPKVESSKTQGETPGEPQKDSTTVTQEATSESTEALLQEILETAVVRNQAIPEELYGKLEKAGRSRAEVDLYVSGTKAQASEIRRSVLSVIDSDLKVAESSYSQMLSWAKENYSPEDAAEFDAAITGKNTSVTRMKQQVELLRNRYVRANGSPQTTHVSGTTSGANTGALFSNTNELRRAMQDPKYGRDAFYTDEVDAKALRSQNAGRI